MRARKFSNVMSGVVVSVAAAASVTGTRIFTKRETEKTPTAESVRNQANIDKYIESPEGGIAKAYRFKM